MGTVKNVDWEYIQDAKQAVQIWKNNGYLIYGIETVHQAAPLYAIQQIEKAVYVFGNEEFGISEEVLALCDQCLEIPQMGMKNSMNVSNAFSVVMYEAARSILLSRDKKVGRFYHRLFNWTKG